MMLPSCGRYYENSKAGHPWGNPGLALEFHLVFGLPSLPNVFDVGRSLSASPHGLVNCEYEFDGLALNESIGSLLT